MAEVKTTQEYLDQNHRSETVQVVWHYMQSGDITVGDQFADASSDFRVRGLVEVAVAELTETAASKAVFDIVVRRICIRDKAALDYFSGRYATLCVTSAIENNSHLDAILIDALRENKVDDYSLALFWIANSSFFGNRVLEWEQGKLSEEAIFNPELFYKIPKNHKAKNGFEDIILALPDKDMLRLLQQYTAAVKNYGRLIWRTAPLQAYLAREKPELLNQYIEGLPGENLFANQAVDWPYITAATTVFDQQCIEYCSQHGLAYPIVLLDGLRDGKHEDLAVKLCCSEEGEEAFRYARFTLSYLSRREVQPFLQKLRYFADHSSQVAMHADRWAEYYSIALEHWDNGGKDACLTRPISKVYEFLPQLLESECNKDRLHEWIPNLWERAVGNSSHDRRLRQQILAYDPRLIEKKLWASLQHKEKGERSDAVEGLRHSGIDNVVDKAKKLLEGKVDARMGVAELLITVGDEKSVTVLRELSKTEQSAKVKKYVVAGLEKLGKGPSLDDPDSVDADPDILLTLESAKTVALSKTTEQWIDLAALPDLHAKNGELLSVKAISYLIAAQAKHKTIKPAPDSIPVLALIDRDKSGDFALGLLKQWLVSECNAADKWVLTLAGILGDRRILSDLSDPISGWAQASRHKLAEYAAQGIALVPADESLMLLDLLANRYRTKYRNIGKACKAALEQAAAAQNISVDELADMIVPTLDFDSDYQRALPDTDIRVVLQPDFKLSFLNPETDKETRTVPKNLPESAKDELKTIKALIRQTIKGQTARLEQDLVRQRSWVTERWHELFEVNPFLQSYASRLVWATLDDKGTQAKLFRRYPNGLLADAAGDLVEFDKADARVVMVHPLSLDDQSLNDWKEHLTRMKIKPPFAQLERAVEKLDKKNANRKQIGFTDGHRMACGTFRSRSEKLGWVRGSVVDGGGITSYTKSYPGALISILLMVEDTYIGQDPADSLLTRHAVFVTADSVEMGSYVYDEPKDTDDPRVIAFGDIPDVVYSESISDLKAILASK